MFKKIETYLKNKIKECLDEQQPKESTKETFATYDLPDINRNEYLAKSIQRTHLNIKSIQSSGSFAMDSACCPSTDKLNNAYNISAPVDDIIYTFYATQCFIGFQACSVLTQNWLINKACSLPAKDAIRPNYTLNYKVPADEVIDNDFLTEIKDVSDDKTKYNIREVARLFAEKKRQFGQILAFPIIDGVDYSLPFNIDAVKPNSYKGMTVVDPVWYAAELDSDAISDPSSLNYFRPTYFRMPDGKKIHYSWCLFNLNGEVPDVLKPTYYWGGYPVPQLIYKRVYAAEKTANEAPMLAMSKRLLVTDINVAAAVTNQKETQDKINALINFRDNFGVVTKRPNENIQQIDTSLTDFDEVIMTQYQLVAAASAVPASKLIETQPKGFNSNGEYEDNQYKMLLASIQEDDLSPLMEFHYQLLCKSKFGLTRYFTVKFDEIDTPTEKERAEINEIQARTDATLVQAGVIAPDEVRQKLINDENSGYNGIDEEITDEDFNDEGGSETPQSPFSMDEPDDWFTSNGAHIPIENGEEQNEAFEKTVEQRREEEQAQKENKNISSLPKKLESLANELKTPKPINEVLKKEGEIAIMKSSLPFKNGELKRVISSASYKYNKDGNLKSFVTEELYDEEDKQYYIYKIYSKDGKIKINKQASKDETIFD